MNNLTLFLDLDGSLKTEYDDAPPFEEPSITIESGTNRYVFASRPNLKIFLDIAVKKAENVILSTAAGGGYARRVLKAIGIETYFTGIIAAEDYSKRYPFKNDKRYIFIDNDRNMVNAKINALIGLDNGIITPNSNHSMNNIETWVIDTYHGSKDDKTMIELAEAINKL
jgi:hypothetical protein